MTAQQAWLTCPQLCAAGAGAFAAQLYMPSVMVAHIASAADTADEIATDSTTSWTFSIGSHCFHLTPSPRPVHAPVTSPTRGSQSTPVTRLGRYPDFPFFHVLYDCLQRRHRNGGTASVATCRQSAAR
jgi:hypothetical protein